MAVFLSVPLKKSSDVDLVTPLKNLIASYYSTADKPEDCTEALNELNSQRAKATSRVLDRHESSLEVLYKYYDQLVSLEAKIPPSDVQIPFKWRDAFDKASLFGFRTSTTIPSMSFEKVCVLFNIAAMQSQIAADQNTEDDGGLKIAAKYFQSASGVFHHLKSIVLSALQRDPTPDLHPDALAAFSALMLAQAQETFVLKAINDSMKDAAIAKVAAQCEEHFSECLKLMQKDVTVRSLWDKDWTQLVGGKQAFYNAKAEYHQSLVCHAQKNVGEEIARLQKAGDLLKAADSKGLNSSAYPIPLKQTIAKYQAAFEKANKDNDFIYHERVPDYTALPVIGRACLAKPSSLPDRFGQGQFRDLFESLTPISVHQALAAYDLRKNEIVNSEVGKLRTSTQLMNSVLVSLNLPASIEDAGGSTVPSSLQEKAKYVRLQGGMHALEKQINELPTLLSRNKEILDECERMLKDESQSDSQLRNQFKDRWTRTPSEKLTEPMTANLNKYRQIINNAVNADSIVRDKFSTHREGMNQLSLPEHEFLSSLPTGPGVRAAQSGAVRELHQLMDDIETMKAERDSIESSLKSATVDMKIKFLLALSKDGAINEAEMSRDILNDTYGDLQKQVRESITRQDQLMSRVQVANTEFGKERASNQGAATREQKLTELAAAHDTFKELISNLGEGIKFYNDLTQLLVNFQNKVNDFCFARKTEKEELMRDMSQTIANQKTPTPTVPSHYQGSQSAGRNTPPQRPPPPNTSTPPTSTPAYPSQQPYAPPTTGAAPGAYPMPMPQPGYPAYPTYPGYNTYPGAQMQLPPMPGGYNPYGQPQHYQAYTYPGAQPPPNAYSNPAYQNPTQHQWR